MALLIKFCWFPLALKECKILNLSIHPRNWSKEERVSFGLNPENKKQNTCKPEGKPASKGIRRRRANLDRRMSHYKGMKIQEQSSSRQPGAMKK